MELDSRAGNVACNEVREHLSDLVDIRRGERPAPGLTPLSDEGLRAALEMHLAGCPACRESFEALGELGAAYLEFSVGERPAQDFTNYGSLVRQRLQGRPVSVVSAERGPRSVFRGWRLVGGGLAAAACVAIAAAQLPLWRNRQSSTGPGATTAHLTHSSKKHPEKLAPSTPREELKVEWRGPQNDVAEVLPMLRPTPNLIQPVDLNQNQAPSVFDPRTERVLSEPVVPETEPAVLQNPSGKTAFMLIYRLGANIISRPLEVDLADDASKDVQDQLNQEMRKLGSLTLSEVLNDQPGGRGKVGLMLRAMAPDSGSEAEPEGLFVAGVLRGSPADRAGLHCGDHLLGINGISFTGCTLAETIKYLGVLKQLKDGDTIQLDFLEKLGNHWVQKRGFSSSGEFE